MGTVTIQVDGNNKTVSRADYIKAKTKTLLEFGYSTLTEDEVSKQLDNVLAGRPLNAIGMFIEGDVVKD